MDGSGIDFIIMPLVILPCLVLWLGGIYFADAHPVWRNGPSDIQPAIAPQEVTALEGETAVPRQRTATVISAELPAGAVPAQAKAVPAAAVNAAADTPGAGDPATGTPAAER